MTATILPLGDTAATVVWPELDDTQAAQRVVSLASAIKAEWRRGYESIVPAFASLTLHYSPLQISWAEVETLLQSIAAICNDEPCQKTRTVEIGVCYDQEFGLDLNEVAKSHGLTPQEVVSLHSSAEYTVRMIGFSPGFPYLAGLPSRLVTPRRGSPRLKVPMGSVAIGGRQTGIYSLDTPGGWNIIGRTPIAMFCPDQNPPCLLNAGDQVRFVPISLSEYQHWQGQP